MLTRKITVLEIPPTGSLDQIIVYFHDLEPGQGHITITCWGQSWTCYFGGMSGQTMREFVSHMGVDYLLSKLSNAPHLKGRKKDAEYLERILCAIKREPLLVGRDTPNEADQSTEAKTK